MDRDTFLDLIPAYTLGALDDDERAEFEARLVDDDEARGLIAEYQKVTEMLVLAAPAREAPAHLAEDLRRRVASKDTPAAVVKPPVRRRSPVMWRWLSAAAVLAVGFGVALALLMQPTPPASPVCPNTQALYRQIISTQGYLRIEVSSSEEFSGVGGELVADPGSNAAILHMKNLPSLNSDQTYQLWLAAPDQTISGGLFQGAGSDTCIILPLKRPFAQYTGFGVSLEAAGGSPNPNRRTGPRVTGVRLGDA